MLPFGVRRETAESPNPGALRWKRSCSSRGTNRGALGRLWLCPLAGPRLLAVSPGWSQSSWLCPLAIPKAPGHPQGSSVAQEPLRCHLSGATTAPRALKTQYLLQSNENGTRVHLPLNNCSNCHTGSSSVECCSVLTLRGSCVSTGADCVTQTSAFQ